MRCTTFFSGLRWIPCLGLKSFLLERHQRSCNQCHEPDGWLQDILREDLGEVDLWSEVHRRLKTPSQMRRQVHFIRSLRWVAAGALILVFTLLLKKGVPDQPHDNSQLVRPVIHALTISGQPARAYYFQCSESSRLIVWAASKPQSPSKENDDDHESNLR